MEGILIWILVVVGFWIFKAVSSNNYQNEIAAIPDLQVEVIKGTMESDSALGAKPCFTVSAKGWVNHPTDENIQLNIHMKDVYQNEDGKDVVMPLQCIIPQWTEGNTRFVSIAQTIKTSPNSYFPDFVELRHIPIEWLSGPFKGKRTIRFFLITTDVGAKSNWGSFSDGEEGKIRHVATADINHTFKEVGFLENFLNRERIENLSIQIALAIAASDGHLDQKELNEIKAWAVLTTSALEEDKANEKKKRLTKFIKEAHAIAKTKRLSTSDLIDEFNDKAIKEQKYDLIDLLLKVASADDELSKKEDLLLTKIVKKLDIDFSTYKEMKDKTLAKVGTIETSASSSEGSANEQLLGLSDDLTDKEKCKELRKLYTKWNGQTNSSNKKTKSRAKEMIQLIAELRSKYNC